MGRKFLVTAILVGGSLASAGFASAQGRKPAADVIVTLVNASDSAVVFFDARKDAAAVGGQNLLKGAVAPKASARVNIGKDCAVTLAVDFENGGSIEPMAHNFCRDRTLRLTSE
jgi:hypothetical protein